MTEDRNKDIIDRNLGDEWSEWVGDLTKYESDIEEGKTVFLVFYFIALFLLTVISMGIWYLIAPRLYELSPIVDLAVLWAISVFFTLLFIWSFMLLVTVTTGQRFIILFGINSLHIEWIYPLVSFLAGIFRISKDRLGNSFIKVNNALVYATKKKFKSGSLLALLPRCLSKDTRMKVTALAEKYSVKTFTATGGSSARQMVRKEKPDAIIGVACERDLVSGMADSPKSIPVIAIANKRPEGPCKNTSIDVDEFEKAIKYLLKI